MQRAAFREQKNVKFGVRSLASSLGIELGWGGRVSARPPGKRGTSVSPKWEAAAESTGSSGFAQSLGSVLVLPLPHCVTLSL